MNDSSRMPIPSLSSLRIGTLLPLQGTLYDVMDLIAMLIEKGSDICDIMKLCTARRCYFEKDGDNQVYVEDVKQNWLMFFKNSKGLFGELINATPHDDFSTKKLYYKAIQCCEVASFVKNPTFEKMKSLSEFELQNDQVRNEMVRAPLSAVKVTDDVRHGVVIACMQMIHVIAEEQEFRYGLSANSDKVTVDFIPKEEKVRREYDVKLITEVCESALKLSFACCCDPRDTQWIVRDNVSVFRIKDRIKLELLILYTIDTSSSISYDEFREGRDKFVRMIKSNMRLLKSIHA